MQTRIVRLQLNQKIVMVLLKVLMVQKLQMKVKDLTQKLQMMVKALTQKTMETQIMKKLMK